MKFGCVKMTAVWIILLITAQLSKSVIGSYQCTMKSFEVNCVGINADQLPGNVSAILNKADIVSLNITNGIITTISPTTFKDFINLQSLYIQNSGLLNLKDDVFSNALDLQDLYLNNNALTEFNLRSVSPKNRLRALDLSNNLLNDFSGFNISYFPRLNLLNLANNLLSYLPVSLLETLEKQNDFYLVADNNPWNCSDPNWSEYLTEKLIDAFCTNKTYNYAAITETEFTNEFTETTEYENISEGSVIKNEPKTVTVETRLMGTEKSLDEFTCEKPNCAKCSFYYCLLWFFCGIWIGIIFGNIGKIRLLICGRPVTYADEYTQCEYSLVDQHMISGVFDPGSHKFLPVSTLGLSVQNKEKNVRLETGL